MKHVYVLLEHGYDKVLGIFESKSRATRAKELKAISYVESNPKQSLSHAKEKYDVFKVDLNNLYLRSIQEE